MRAVNERIRDKYPLFYAYGEKHKFLDKEGALGATAEGRIKSVWPYIVRRVLSFERILKPRERANFDVEDIVAELWVALASKDDQWTPDRGKYITFAGVIIERELCSIRDKARTVQSPRNSSCRLKKYREEEAAGTLTERRRLTAADISRTCTIAGAIGSRGTGEDEDRGPEPTVTDNPLATLAERERADGIREGLREALSRLTPIESEVITRSAGLGVEAVTTSELALAVGRTEKEVRRAKERAMAKVRKRLAETGNPFYVNRN